MTQYSGVFTLQQQGQALTSGQWCTDPYYRNTTLLLHADNVSGSAQNNTFVDSSSNGFAITRNGNTTQGSFTPYGPTWSNYFDGDGSALTFPTNTAFAFGTGDVTIEAWIFDAGTTASYGQIIGASTYGVGNDFLFSFNGSTKTLFAQFGSSGGSASTGTVSSNTWTHVAVVRSGSTVTFYINGVSGGSYTDSDSVSSTIAPTIGTSSNNNSDARFKGYISNLRITKGGALYTGTFFPSTTPLTTTVSAGTVSLLTCQSNRFIDNSTANSGSGFAVTVGGTPSVQRFSPFAPQYQYTPAVIGGSGYFTDSSGLTVPTNTALVLGTNQFTIEAWVYITQWIGGSSQIANKRAYNSTGTGTWALSVTTSGQVLFDQLQTPATIVSTATGVIATNNWYHIAVCRDSSNVVRLFVNGVNAGTTSPTSTFNFSDNSNDLLIGRNNDASGYRLIGYMSDFRIVNGTGVYTSTFTPPTAPLTAITNTSILCNYTNAGIYDNAMMNNLETVGNAQVSTNVVKYGSGSLAFDGSGDYLSYPTSTSPAFGSSDFTVEFWVYVTSLPSTRTELLYLNANTSGYAAIALHICSNNTLGLSFSESGSGWKTDDTTGRGSALTAGVWQHVGLVRNGQNIQIYLNGIAQGSAYTTTASGTSLMTTFTLNQIGVYNSGYYYFNGYMDDLRITNGVARYTANFQPPKVAFANQ